MNRHGGQASIWQVQSATCGYDLYDSSDHSHPHHPFFNNFLLGDIFMAHIHAKGFYSQIPSPPYIDEQVIYDLSSLEC